MPNRTPRRGGQVTFFGSGTFPKILRHRASQIVLGTKGFGLMSPYWADILEASYRLRHSKLRSADSVHRRKTKWVPSVPGAWKRELAGSLPRVVKDLQERLPGDPILIARLGHHGTGIFELYIVDRVDGGPLRVMTEGYRSVTLRDRSARNLALRVRREYFEHLRSKGERASVGRQATVNFMKFYRRIKLRCVLLTASWLAGGYVWAKAGFLPRTERDWRRLQWVLAERWTLFEQEVAASSPRGREEAEFVNQAVLQGTSNRHILALVPQLQAPVKGATVKQILRATGREHIADDVDFTDDDVVSLGKALLFGTTWRGMLDLRDIKQTERFNDFAEEKVL